MDAAPTTKFEEPVEGPVVRDKRRIDPATGAIRPDVATSAAESAPPAEALGAVGAVPQATAIDPLVADLEHRLEERTADLQRVKAEYDNYRRRIERDRLAVAEQALASVLVGLLPVLDDIDRARAHGELEGGFKSVADSLHATVQKLGLERFGSTGEPFDPTVHEALMHTYADSVPEPTCVQILQPGYRLGQRVLRPARVAVAEPQHDPAAPDATTVPNVE